MENFCPANGITVVIFRRWQECFLRDKGGRCLGLRNLPFSRTNFLKSVNLSLLEPSRSAQAPTGTALALPALYQPHPPCVVH